VTGLDVEALVQAAMALAAEAGERGDPPFGAVLVDPTDTVVARAANRQASSADPTAHAELELLRTAASAGHAVPLSGYTIAINAEPCSMCASALVKAGVSRIVFGAPHESHMDPDLPLADVLARTRRPPEVIARVMAAEAAMQIGRYRAGRSPVD